MSGILIPSHGHLGDQGTPADEWFFVGEMSDYPVFHYTSKQILRVGEELAGTISYEDGNEAQLAHARELFKIAYDWRNSHIYPMRRIHYELIGNSRANKKIGFTSARVKRMLSIRDKLRRSSTKYNQMQDLCGCRAVMNSFSDYEELVKMYSDGKTAHKIRNTSDYIANPRASGYRSHHIILDFQANQSEYQHQGRRIELQIRTGLQHAWATAVEAVGIIRGENLKAGDGNEDWLRLFALMSSEFANEESCPLVPGTPENRRIRQEEIKHLNRKLDAIVFLEHINQTFNYAPSYTGSAKFYLVQIDVKNKTVSVSGANKAIDAAEKYNNSEGSKGIISVLAEVDKIQDLKRAFPNYFMDVQVFTDHLNTIVYPNRLPKIAQKATGELKQTKKKSSTFQDLSWLKYFQRPNRK